MFFLLSFMLFLQQNMRTEGKTGSPQRQGGRVAHIMCTHVSKCNNNKIKFKKLVERPLGRSVPVPWVLCKQTEAQL
jgi:hypothetical protein